MQNVQTLKGFRDFLPEQAKKRQYVINTLKQVFELYGFEPLETPALEYEEILTGKYGTEGDKLMYRFEDNGKRRVAMRYDQTVPLARVVAQYQNELTFPFKRYQIQNVWRADNPQRGRYREFLQVDADIVGSSSSIADAEIIATAVKGLQALKFTKFKILMNDRRVFLELVEKGVVNKEEMIIAVRSIDKIKKISEIGVLQEMTSKGLSENRAKEILQVIKDQEKTDTLQDIDIYLENLDLDKSFFEFDRTLARGLDYYTGLIFEIEVEGYDVGSIAGGGRYDNLIGMFAKQSIPAVGFAYGFDRIIEAMDLLNLFPANLQTTDYLVTIFSPEQRQVSQKIYSLLRSKGVKCELFPDENAKMEKQLKYASQKGIPFVVVVRPEEAKNQTVTVKNMQTRQQKTLKQSELINKIK